MDASWSSTVQSADRDDGRAAAGVLGQWTAVSTVGACIPTVISSVAAAAASGVVEDCRRRNRDQRRRLVCRDPPRSDTERGRRSVAVRARGRPPVRATMGSWRSTGRQHSTTPYSLPATASTSAGEVYVIQLSRVV